MNTEKKYINDSSRNNNKSSEHTLYSLRPNSIYYTSLLHSCTACSSRAQGQGPYCTMYRIQCPRLRTAYWAHHLNFFYLVRVCGCVLMCQRAQCSLFVSTVDLIWLGQYCHNLLPKEQRRATEKTPKERPCNEIQQKHLQVAGGAGEWCADKVN